MLRRRQKLASALLPRGLVRISFICELPLTRCGAALPSSGGEALAEALFGTYAAARGQGVDWPPAVWLSSEAPVLLCAMLRSLPLREAELRKTARTAHERPYCADRTSRAPPAPAYRMGWRLAGWFAGTRV